MHAARDNIVVALHLGGRDYANYRKGGARQSVRQLPGDTKKDDGEHTGMTGHL